VAVPASSDQRVDKHCRNQEFLLNWLCSGGAKTLLGFIAGFLKVWNLRQAVKREQKGANP
jgi:hypothetical protein